MTPVKEDKLQAQRHSLAHLLAAAVMELWPDTKRTIGPAIDNGFYFDFDFQKPISEDDLSKIEAKMREILPKWDTFSRHELSVAEAKKEYPSNQFKHELIDEFSKSGDKLGFYKSGDYWDLCKGGHVEHMGEIDPKSFKLDKLAGAYWRGDEKNKMLTRIYGLAFETEKELKEYLVMLEEAKTRDHRKLGAELDLFFFHETAPGMPYWLPRGVVVYNELIRFWREEHAKRGYQETVSPLLNKKELYQTSGHFDHYWENMFTSKTEEDEEYGLKAMNCPNAMLIYKHKTRSYRDLPLRLGDTDTLHRYELSGTLNGLFRVREFRQDDAHIFVTEDQIKEEYKRVLEITELFYSVFDMKYSFRLGTRPDKFMGDPKLWDRAEKTLKEILEESGKDHFVLEGDGAFYGPKIDILMQDVLGRDWQMGTIQLDFQQPLRFELTYADQDGKDKTPIAIHRVIYGSLERFIGILIEHLAGKFPVWLAPEQVRIATVNQEDVTVKFADKLLASAKDLGLRATVDNSNESVGKKIRAAEVMKVPYTLVIGQKEIESGKLQPRIRADLAGQKESQPIDAEKFFAAVANEAKNRLPKTSL